MSRTMKLSFINRKHRARGGFTIIEVCVALGLGLLAMAVILFNNDGMKAMFSKGTCIGNQRNVQTVAKAYATTNDLDTGASLPVTAIIGSGLPIATAPTCRGGGTYTALGTVPASGVRYYPDTGIAAHVATSLANW